MRLRLPCERLCIVLCVAQRQRVTERERAVFFDFRHLPLCGTPPHEFRDTAFAVSHRSGPRSPVPVRVARSHSPILCGTTPVSGHALSIPHLMICIRIYTHAKTRHTTTNAYDTPLRAGPRATHVRAKHCHRIVAKVPCLSPRVAVSAAASTAHIMHIAHLLLALCSCPQNRHRGAP